MIGDTTGGSGRFFEAPQAGCCFARIEHFDIGSGHGVDMSASEGRHAAQTLQKIERNPLALKKGAGAT